MRPTKEQLEAMLSGIKNELKHAPREVREELATASVEHSLVAEITALTVTHYHVIELIQMTFGFSREEAEDITAKVMLDVQAKVLEMLEKKTKGGN